MIVFPFINGQCLLILCMFTRILDPFTCLFYQPQAWLPSPQSPCGQRWMLHLQTSHHNSGSRNEKGRGWTKDAFPEALPSVLSQYVLNHCHLQGRLGKCSLPVGLSAQLSEGERKNGYWVGNQSLPHPYTLPTFIKHFGGAVIT